MALTQKLHFAVPLPWPPIRWPQHETPPSETKAPPSNQQRAPLRTTTKALPAVHWVQILRYFSPASTPSTNVTSFARFLGAASIIHDYQIFDVITLGSTLAVDYFFVDLRAVKGRDLGFRGKIDEMIMRGKFMAFEVWMECARGFAWGIVIRVFWVGVYGLRIGWGWVLCIIVAVDWRVVLDASLSICCCFKVQTRSRRHSAIPAPF